MVIRRTWVNGCRQQLCVQNCGQTAADKDMVTIDSYKNSSLPYPRNDTIASPYTTYFFATISHD